MTKKVYKVDEQKNKTSKLPKKRKKVEIESIKNKLTKEN